MGVLGVLCATSFLMVEWTLEVQGGCYGSKKSWSFSWVSEECPQPQNLDQWGEGPWGLSSSPQSLSSWAQPLLFLASCLPETER